MLTLRPVVQDDLPELFELSVRKDQRGFVAPNAMVLAEAPFEKGSQCFAIRQGKTAIGLLGCIDFRVNDQLGPGDDDTSIFLWRFMIDADHQGKGFGRQAMGQFLDWCRDQKAPAVTLEVGRNNAPATGLYKSLGFSETGRAFDDELEYRLVL